ncbi:hypothetical protein [Pyruvatibacter sp.]|uniref:hypothetical protein n=1 Tax=Pyruvatibacter sp. TaxID=1981328 RepID=UPI0032EB95D2
MNTPATTPPDIRFCTAGDIVRVQHFLDTHWAKGHVLAHDHTLMDWQHADPANNRYSFVVAQRPGEPEPDAILGFITTRQYAEDITDSNAVWLTTWMVNPAIKAGGLGMRLVRFLQQNEPHTLIGTVGNNAAVAPVYKALGYTTGTLDRYVIINPFLREQHLLRGAARAKSATARPANAVARPLTHTDLCTPQATKLLAASAIPKKTAAYIAARYLHHPTYEYTVYGISTDDAMHALAVTRLCTAKGATALRVVDWFGPDAALAPTGNALQDLITRTGAEYADIYVHGIPASAFNATEWQPVPADGPLTVPNYFEPFDAANTDIRFAVKTSVPNAPVRLFKADADQDRPNTVSSHHSASAPAALTA